MLSANVATCLRMWLTCCGLVYFTNFHNQPYCFFHESNMRRRLRNGDIPQYLLLVFAASAARYSRDEYFMPNPLVATESYARQAWALLKTQVFDSEFCLDLDAAQATVSTQDGRRAQG